MSISFYYVVTFNVQHPTVKKFLDKLNISAICDSLIELKTRSKLYLDFEQASQSAHDDFDLKLKMMYDHDQKDQMIRCISATNPMFDPDAEDTAYDQGDWEEWCAGSIFFGESDEDEEDDEMPMEPGSWMIKYEIFYIEDAIEVMKNGEMIYCPGSHNTTATYQ